ncbi:hypothetical protein [Thermosulfurimonas sp. F29]|uniref:hypothetical protein n=1 Tax=Thermosulfurimonas sp. F29 TaxID=2867247 RepID=UPI001C82944A|nr:hypothetical protein [Thermosulfurimonas sp. F29]MBX6423364.1 hypothetical protein [Thermosulfurimonas sp. F29]
MTVSYGEFVRRGAQVLRDEKPRERAAFYFSPSNAGACKRELFLEATGRYRFEPDDILLGIMQDGETHEDLTLRQLREGGVEVVGVQAPLDLLIEDAGDAALFLAGSGYARCPVCGVGFESGVSVLHGHADALLRNPETGETEVFEHKAVSGAHFDRLTQVLEKKGFGPFFRESRRYVVQAGLYAAVLGLSEERGAEAVLFYKNRNRPEFLEVRLRYEPGEDALRFVEAHLVREGRARRLSAEPVVLARFLERLERRLRDVGQAVRMWRESGGENAFVEVLKEVRRLTSDELRECRFCEARMACARTFGGLLERQRTAERDEGERREVRPEDLGADEETHRRLEELAEQFAHLDEELKRIEKQRDEAKRELTRILDEFWEKGMLMPNDCVRLPRVRVWRTVFEREEFDRQLFEGLSEEEKEVVRRCLTSRVYSYWSCRTEAASSNPKREKRNSVAKNRMVSEFSR